MSSNLTSIPIAEQELTDNVLAESAKLLCVICNGNQIAKPLYSFSTKEIFMKTIILILAIITTGTMAQAALSLPSVKVLQIEPSNAYGVAADVGIAKARNYLKQNDFEIISVYGNRAKYKAGWFGEYLIEVKANSASTGKEVTCQGMIRIYRGNVSKHDTYESLLEISGRQETVANTLDFNCQ